MAADDVTAFEIDEMPEDAAGTVDRVVIFRSMHGLNMNNQADDVLKAARKMLKDDGMVGVVQHRAPKGASYDEYGAKQRGYMRKQDVVAIFESNGFELVAESEINANPNDPANWEGGVWTLPPMLSFGRQSEEDQAKHNAIGESDRMTLLFKKAN
jgi:predicted methyltransferase